MTTSDVATISKEKLGDGNVTVIDTIDSASVMTGTNGVIADGDNLGANVGTQIREVVLVTGQDGGFNVGGNYLAFQGQVMHLINARFASLSAIGFYSS